MYSRRDLGKMMLTSLPVATLAGTRLRAAAISDAAANGVQLGASTYSFRDLPRTTGADNVDARRQGSPVCRCLANRALVVRR